MASYIVLVHWFACIWFWLSNKHQNPELQPAYEEEKWTVLMKGQSLFGPTTLKQRKFWCQLGQMSTRRAFLSHRVQ